MIHATLLYDRGGTFWSNVCLADVAPQPMNYPKSVGVPFVFIVAVYIITRYLVAVFNNTIQQYKNETDYFTFAQGSLDTNIDEP